MKRKAPTGRRQHEVSADESLSLESTQSQLMRVADNLRLATGSNPYEKPIARTPGKSGSSKLDELRKLSESIQKKR